MPSYSALSNLVSGVTKNLFHSDLRKIKKKSHKYNTSKYATQKDLLKYTH